MKFKTLQGREKKVIIKDYLIKWDEISASKAQMAVKTFLKPYWKAKVVCEEFMLPGTRYRMDFLNITNKIAIEYQGEQHDDPKSHYFENPNDFLNSLRRDHKKAEWCEINGYTLVEIYPNDLPLTKKFFKEKYQIEL